MIIGIPKETYPGENRVALIPSSIPPLTKGGAEVLVESGAGVASGFTDASYEAKGAKVIPSRSDLFAKADVLLQVRGLGANPEAGQADLPLMRAGQTAIAMLDPLTALPEMQKLAQTGATSFAMELMPRITRAQSMDVLSAMATLAGYKAVLLGAAHLPKIFPMLMTAAGTIAPARVFIIGAGVAGLQAISTARRLGAQVQAFDVRPAVKEQVQSLGAKFLEVPLELSDAEDKGGYAKALGEEFYKKQRELMSKALSDTDLVITTALIPGKQAPLLVTKEMVAGMQPGSVVVDLAAERGGNCELTRPGETHVTNGVTILGPLNLPSTLPFHASQMYAKTISTFLLHLLSDGQIKVDLEDEITRETLVAKDGQIVNPRLLELAKA
jgi:NAD(P) transhydrogenase subunit alpha